MFNRMGYSPKPIGSFLSRSKKRLSSKISVEGNQRKTKYFKNKTDIINPNEKDEKFQSYGELRRKTGECLKFIIFRSPANAFKQNFFKKV